MAKSDINWAQGRAIELLNKFKASGHVPYDWRFRFDESKSHFGLCNYGLKTIFLSVHYAVSADHKDVEDTILHEIAHIIAGPGAGHGPKWKRACYTTGAKPVRCGKNVEDWPSAYKAKCEVCNSVYHAQRILKNMDKRLCSKRMCSARARKKYLVWTINR